jgi:hypothetical protein
MGYGGARNVVDLPFVALQRLVWFGLVSRIILTSLKITFSPSLIGLMFFFHI